MNKLTKFIQRLLTIKETKMAQINGQTKAPKTYRQGDVLLVQVKAYPEKAVKLDHATVALGEATGHHHTFTKNVELMELDEQVWVVADESAPLTHQEHATILVAPGIYEVRIQREYEPQEAQGFRNVLD